MLQDISVCPYDEWETSGAKVNQAANLKPLGHQLVNAKALHTIDHIGALYWGNELEYMTNFLLNVVLEVSKPKSTSHWSTNNSFGTNNNKKAYCREICQ